MWGDILGGDPDRIAALPDGVTVCEWGYDAGHPFDVRAAATYADARYARSGSRPGTSSWLTILGRTTNMRAQQRRGRRRRGSRTAAAGSSTPTGATRATCSTCRSASPGLAYGAAVAWCVDSNRDLDLGAALVHALLRRSRPASSAQTLVELGDLYLDAHPADGERLHARAPPLLAPARTLGGGRSRG